MLDDIFKFQIIDSIIEFFYVALKRPRFSYVSHVRKACFFATVLYLACPIYSFQNHHYSYSYSRKNLHYSLDLCLFSKMLPLFPGIFPQNNGILQFSVYNFLKLTDFEKIDLKRTDLKKYLYSPFSKLRKNDYLSKNTLIIPGIFLLCFKKGSLFSNMLGIFFSRKRFIIPATYAGIYGAGQDQNV